MPRILKGLTGMEKGRMCIKGSPREINGTIKEAYMVCQIGKGYLKAEMVYS